jgi:integrase
VTPGPVGCEKNPRKLASFSPALLFPAPRGGYLGLDAWRTREWYPALEAAGLDKRGPYHLRHTFATEALAAGVTIFELARLMGTSVAMIDRTYGHLARESEAAILARLAARTTPAVRNTTTEGGTPCPKRAGASGRRIAATRPRTASTRAEASRA